MNQIYRRLQIRSQLNFKQNAAGFAARRHIEKDGDKHARYDDK